MKAPSAATCFRGKELDARTQSNCFGVDAHHNLTGIAVLLFRLVLMGDQIGVDVDVRAVRCCGSGFCGFRLGLRGSVKFKESSGSSSDSEVCIGERL